MAFKFDLFALPSVALNQVLVNMDLNSLLNFTISSKTCERIVKWSNLYRKPTKFELKYFFNRSQLIISFENGSTLLVSIGKSETLEENGSNRRFLKNNKFSEDYKGIDGYHTYWQDVPTATKIFVEFLTNLFKISIDCVSIDKPSGIDNEEFNSFLNWIPSTQILHVSPCKPSDWNEEVDGEYKDVDNDGQKLMTIVSAVFQQLNPITVNGAKYEVMRNADGAVASILTDTYRATLSVEVNSSEPPAKRRRI